MSVALINSHVLFAHTANWRTLPEWSRRWENQISDGVTGAESRFALRTSPRISLSYLITPPTPIEQALLDARILTAKKSGKACAPFRGRGCLLNVACSTNAVVLQANFWPWKIGDTIYFQAPGSAAYETRTLTAVAGVNLTLNAAVTQTYAAGALVWPMIFGKFSCDDMSVRTDHHGALKITISELTSPASEQIGAVEPPEGDGIGVMIIGSTFAVS